MDPIFENSGVDLCTIEYHLSYITKIYVSVKRKSLITVGLLYE